MITYDVVPLEQVNIDKLRTLLASPEFALLKSVIGARATLAALKFTNATLYDTDAAKEHAEASLHQAKALTAAMDVLDELADKQEWFAIKLDQRR